MPLASSYGTTPRKTRAPPSPVSTKTPATAYPSSPRHVYSARAALTGHRSLPSFSGKNVHTPSVTPTGAPSAPASPVTALDFEYEDEVPTASPERPVPFHEQLLQKGKLSEQRREALREKAITAEMKHCKEKPTISKSASSKTYSVPIHIRAQQRTEQKKRDLEAATQAAALAADAEAKAYSFKPKITKMGKMTIGKAKDSADAKAKNLKRQSAYEQQVISDLSECVFKPEINSRSARLAEKHRGIGGPNYTHADSLMDRSQQARLKTFLKNQTEEDIFQAHNPCISQFAARLDLNEDVVERLYGNTVQGQTLQARPQYSVPHSIDDKTYL